MKVVSMPKDKYANKRNGSEKCRHHQAYFCPNYNTLEEYPNHSFLSLLRSIHM